jgi:hypothetical protein
MSKGSWSVRPTELARFVKSVTAAGLPVRNVEFSTESKVVRVNVGHPDDGDRASGSSDKQEDLRSLL